MPRSAEFAVVLRVPPISLYGTNMSDTKENVTLQDERTGQVYLIPKTNVAYVKTTRGTGA